MASFDGSRINVAAFLVFMCCVPASARTCSVSELYDVCKCISDDHAQCFVDSRCAIDAIYGFVDKLELWISTDDCDPTVLFRQVKRIDYGRVIIYGDASCQDLPRCTRLVIALSWFFRLFVICVVSVVMLSQTRCMMRCSG